MSQLQPQPRQTSSTDSDASTRKRVCKACDRCRLKKGKCDGSHPCFRCTADNAICVFSETKKSHDKKYPKGYVAMLETQQRQLVAGLREMYRRLLVGEAWKGAPLPEIGGHPLTHEILAALNLLQTKHGDSEEVEAFDEDGQKLQSKLLVRGAEYVQRRCSFKSDSEHSLHRKGKSLTHNTPKIMKPSIHKGDLSSSASPSPHPQSPIAQQRQARSPSQQSPLHRSLPLANDLQLNDSSSSASKSSNTEALFCSNFAMQAPQLRNDLDGFKLFTATNQWDDQYGANDSNMSGLTSYQQQLFNALSSVPRMQDFNAGLDPIDLEFSRFIQVAMN